MHIRRLPTAFLEQLEPRELLAAPPIPVTNNAFTITDNDTDVVTVKLTGPGTLSAADAGGQNRISRITLTGTTASSTLNVSVTKGASGDGLVKIGLVECDGELNVLNGAKADFIGAALSFAGRVKEFKAHDVLANTVTMGGDLTQKTKFTARSVVNATLDFGARLVSSIRIDKIDDTTVNAGAVGTWVSKRVVNLTASGDVLSVEIHLVGVAGVARTLNSWSVEGQCAGVHFDVAGEVGTLACGTFGGSDLTATGGVQLFKTTVGGVGGTYRAAFFKSIIVKGVLDADMGATDSTANGGLSFGSISAHEISADVNVLGSRATGARIGAVKADLVSFLDLNAGSIGSFKIAGAALDAEINLEGTSQTQTLDTFSIGDRFTGNLIVRSSAGKLSFGAIDNAVILVGVLPANGDPEDIRDHGLPSNAIGLFDGFPTSTIKSLSFPKPKSSSGFNAGNPNVGVYWILARRIETFSMFGAFSKSDNGGTKFGLGVERINSFTFTAQDGTVKVSNLDNVKLIALAANDPNIEINDSPQSVESSLVGELATSDSRIRLYK